MEKTARKVQNRELRIQNRKYSFFQSYSKELLGQTVFLKATQRVMTEGFLKPNAKTAFFKAILKLKSKMLMNYSLPTQFSFSYLVLPADPAN